MTALSQVLRKIDADEVVELTRALVRIPSVYRPGDPAGTEAQVAAFVEAWLRVRGATPGAREEARRRFLAPLRAHLDAGGVGHVSEVASAEAPHGLGGCPFQAWSLGELLRVERLVERPGAGTISERPLVAMAP